jgi:hypothetical protein
MKAYLLAPAAVFALSACAKKEGTTAAPEPAALETAAPDNTAPAETAAAGPVAPVEAAPAAEPTLDDAARAEKEGQLAYALMEDSFISDPKGQWANAATASSSYNDDVPGEAPAFGRTSALTGAPDTIDWTPKGNEVGIDWFEASVERPVSATEIRMAMAQGAGAISKIEVVDETGARHEVWSGVDAMQPETRGDRTWYITKLEPSPYKVKAVRFSIAHAMSAGVKYVDAVQIVGE